MREFKYDVIQLIHGVRDRPCLWDKTKENYKDRVERRNAWEEIFNTLDDTYEEMTAETKRITGEHILNKWTNIRDTFMKSLKTRMGRPKKKYLLYNHLEFLTKIIPEEECNREVIINEEPTYMKQEIEPDPGFTITSDIEPETTTSFTISGVTSYGTKKNSKRSDFDDTKSTDYNTSEVSYNTKRSKRSDFDAKSIDYNVSEVSYGRKKKKSGRFIFVNEVNDSKDTNYSKKKTKKSSAKDNEDASMNDHLNDIDFVEVDDNDPRIMNEDEAFFASLLPTVVKYNEDERLEFRIEVLGIMKKLKDKKKWLNE